MIDIQKEIVDFCDKVEWKMGCIVFIERLFGLVMRIIEKTCLNVTNFMTNFKEKMPCQECHK